VIKPGPINLRSFIWLLISDVGLELRGNINRFAIVTIVLCNILLLHDVLGSLQIQQIVFLSHWYSYAVLSLKVVAMVYIVTWGSGFGGIEAYLSRQLASFSSLALFIGLSGLCSPWSDLLAQTLCCWPLLLTLAVDLARLHLCNLQEKLADALYD